jgi:hypothetical protein
MFSGGSTNGTWNASGNPVGTSVDPLTIEAYTSPTVLNQSGDTRPRNIALMFIIKF